MKKNKMVILVAVTLGVLAYNLIFLGLQLNDYNKRKEKGNKHWEMVANEIVQMKENIDVLENDIKIYHNID